MDVASLGRSGGVTATTVAGVAAVSREGGVSSEKTSGFAGS